MKNKKLDELTNKLRMIDSEHHKLEEEAFNKRQEYEVTVSVCDMIYYPPSYDTSNKIIMAVILGENGPEEWIMIEAIL